MIAQTMPKSLENIRIKVYSEKSGVWNQGKVIKFLENSRRFKVEFENEKEQRIDLTKVYFVINSEPIKQSSSTLLPIKKDSNKYKSQVVKLSCSNKLLGKSSNKILGKRPSKQKIQKNSKVSGKSLSSKRSKFSMKDIAIDPRIDDLLENEILMADCQWQIAEIEGIQILSMEISESIFDEDTIFIQQTLQQEEIKTDKRQNFDNQDLYQFSLNQGNDQIQQDSEEQQILDQYQSFEEDELNDEDSISIIQEQNSNQQPKEMFKQQIYTEPLAGFTIQDSDCKLQKEQEQNPEESQILKDHSKFRNPQEMMEHLLGGRAKHQQIPFFTELIPDFDFEMFFSDTMKVFYKQYEDDYKICSCSSCDKLQYPILINKDKDPNSFKGLHAIYLSQFINQQQDAASKLEDQRQNLQDEKINNIRVMFY
ncbi:UNKNOWN [Stylonychia lemnae]|uniref:Uncharacterized protein n=1 Tax=Stylonychia lemnae TaxID=5949 RepID=A0A078A5P8_STYLE|nr:UNKNOWN [Stylonychia lemnae]|eukprot:CDW76089.1 UNKNOWN [Stylonychia lemnae]